MAGVVHIPWYATGFRHNKLADALAGIAPIAVRYGARSYSVYRSQDDLYKFLQTAEFETKAEWERYWYGPEFTDFRALTSSWYQVPVLYAWNEVICAGTLEPEPANSSVASADVAG
jgi:hypothetical protein